MFIPIENSIIGKFFFKKFVFLYSKFIKINKSIHSRKYSINKYSTNKYIYSTDKYIYSTNKYIENLSPNFPFISQQKNRKKKHFYFIYLFHCSKTICKLSRIKIRYFHNSSRISLIVPLTKSKVYIIFPKSKLSNSLVSAKPSLKSAGYRFLIQGKAKQKQCPFRKASFLGRHNQLPW